MFSRNCAKPILTAIPYQAHGWFIARQNPAMSLPDRGRTLEAFGKMDFIATVDIIMNDTSWFSDVVLPEASYLERYDPLNIVGDKAFLRQPVIEPQGEGKSACGSTSNWASASDLGDFFQYADEEDYLSQQLAPLGVSPRRGQRQKGYVDLPGEGPESSEPAWNTPSGKIELYSRRHSTKAGFSGVPTWEEPPAARRRPVLPADRQGGAIHPVWHARTTSCCTNIRMNRACG